MNSQNMLGYSPEDFAIFKRNAWKVLWGFSILYCFLYCARLNLGLSIGAMVEQTSWTEEDLGILSAIFFWTYGMGHLFNGRLGEIFGVNRFIVTGVFLSAAANVLISFQASLMVIAVLWGLNGYFQSMLWSPGMALLARWWPGRSRGFATGIANAFSGFGQVAAWISVFAAFSIAPGMGWRAAFVFPVIAMVVIVIFYKFIVKGRPSEIALQEYEEADPDRKALEEELRQTCESKGKIYPYVYLFRQWRFDLWLIIIAGSSIARYGLLTWIPLYYVQVLDMSVKEGIVGTVLLPLGMGFGTLIIPWATDKFCPTNRLPAVIICSLIAGGTVFLFPQITSLTGAAALLFVAGFFIYAINGVVWAYATDIGGRVFSGTAAGVLDCFAYLGASVQAIYFGSVLTNTGNWHLVFLVITVTCVVIAIAAAIAGRGMKLKSKAV